MKFVSNTLVFVAVVSLCCISATVGFAPPPNRSNTNNAAVTVPALQASIGDTGVAFENVAREWRCKVSKSKCIYILYIYNTTQEKLV